MGAVTHRLETRARLRMKARRERSSAARAVSSYLCVVWGWVGGCGCVCGGGGKVGWVNEYDTHTHTQPAAVRQANPSIRKYLLQKVPLPGQELEGPHALQRLAQQREPRVLAAHELPLRGPQPLGEAHGGVDGEGHEDNALRSFMCV